MTGRSAGKKIGLIVAIAIVLLGAMILFLFDPTRVPIYPVCSFHTITGLDCPGCGGLRATHALLHGDIAAALHFNAMVVVSVPLLALLGGWFAYCKRTQQPFRFRMNWLWAYLAVWIAFSVLRDLPIPFFAAFAP